jgi:hypothetical protein
MSEIITDKYNLIDKIVITNDDIKVIKPYLDKYSLELNLQDNDDNSKIIRLKEFTNIAYTFFNNSENVACEFILRQIYKRFREIFGPKSIHTLKIYDDYSKNMLIMFSKQQYSNTDYLEFVLKNNIKLKISVFSMNHYETLNSMVNIVNFYNLSWSLDNSIIVIDTILKHCDNVNDFNHFTFLASVMELANNLFVSKRIDEAKYYHSLVIQISQRTLNDNQKEKIYNMVDDFFKMFLTS